MDERERLKELLRKVESHWSDYTDWGTGVSGTWEEFYADQLLANGVIVPPCKIGTHLWKVTHPYRQEPKVTEFVVKNFRTTGKKHTLQIEVQAVNVSVTNWMQYKDFCTTREEAEAKLREKSE